MIIRDRAHMSIGNSFSVMTTTEDGKHNSLPMMKLGNSYTYGMLPPRYPVPALRKCCWCGSKHIGHKHFIADDGLIVPM